jgi:cbb3-type cytochrome oxidase subunit 3
LRLIFLKVLFISFAKKILDFSLNNFFIFFITIVLLLFCYCAFLFVFGRHAHGTRAREWEPSLPIGTTHPLLKEEWGAAAWG